MKNNVLYICGIYPDNVSILQKKNKYSLDYAADTYQKKILKGLKKNFNVSTLSFPFIGSFPKNSKICVYKHHNENGDTFFGSFLNLPFISKYSKKIQTLKCLRNWLKNQSNTSTTIFIYSSYFSFVAKYIKKRFKFVNIVLYLPDMPKYTYLSSNSLVRKIYINNCQKELEKNLKYCDVCVCITESMNRHLTKRGARSLITVEGFANEERCAKNIATVTDNEGLIEGKNGKTILYTGIISNIYGAKTLIEAFKLLQSDVELFFAGGIDDSSKDFFENAILNEERIHYLGILPHNEIIRLQEQMSVLVNPRPSNETFTSFSLPSKTVEYMETGNPVVCFDLPGIPQDYKKFLFIAKRNTPEELAKMLNVALLLDKKERKKLAFDELSFLLKYKTEGKQIEKIMSVLYENI